MIEAIKTIGDVVTFSKQLIDEGCNFHPDDDFTNFVHVKTGKSSYSAKGGNLRNKLMKQALYVCEKQGVDIYDLTMTVYLIQTGLDKFIPLPSQIKVNGQ